MNSSRKAELKRAGWLLTLGVVTLFTSIASLMTSCLSAVANWFGTMKTLCGKKLEELEKSVD